MGKSVHFELSCSSTASIKNEFLQEVVIKIVLKYKNCGKVF